MNLIFKIFGKSPHLGLRRYISTYNSMHLPTVYALSSGHGKCGVAVIRVTGSQTKKIFEKMLPQESPLKPRQAHLKYIYDPVSGVPLDKALVLWFPGPKSFTGEDMLELQVHGGPAVIKSVLSALGSIETYRPAEAGDFTKRAFYNGKIDLTKTEGLGDLIHAESEMQRRQAFKQMEGSLSDTYSTWRSLLIECRGTIDAYIDFGEDQNIEANVIGPLKKKISQLLSTMKAHLNDSRKGERLRDGLKVVIIGRPNVGKSSLLNEIAQKPAAIVNPVAGTTRDIIEVPLDIGGYPLILSDTAGLRSTENPIEAEGVKRAISRVEKCDIGIVMIESTELLRCLSKNVNLHEFMKSYLNSLNLQYKEDYIIFVNKSDLLSASDKIKIKDLLGEKGTILSLVTREGFLEALELLKGKCGALCSSGDFSESPYLTSSRHRTHIAACVAELEEIMCPSPEVYGDLSCLLDREDTLEFVSQNLRLATIELESVVGQITTEEILDYIFSSFCIGK